MKIKEGASIAGLDIKMRIALITADKLWKEYGQELVITSGLDGVHSAGSLHYYGLALDLRTNYFANADKADIADDMRSRLRPLGFDVALEKTHLHVEYDPK